MSTWRNRQSPPAEALIEQLKRRAGNLYLTRQLLCAEAVLVTLNKGLDGGLRYAQAISMAAPFSMALGESGCICGALSGAIMACGLFAGNGRPYHRRQGLRQSARQLHDAFKSTYGATCCRVLSRRVKHDRRVHFQQCAGLTSAAAEMAARLILYQRPELAKFADNGFLDTTDTKSSGVVTRLLRLPWLKT